MSEPSDAVRDFVRDARTGELDDVRAALASGTVGVGDASYEGVTALLYASANGHTDVVKELLASRATPSKTNTGGNSPLHWAALNGHLDVVKALLEARADGNLRNAAQKRPFDEAFSRHHGDVCEIIAPATDMSKDYVETEADKKFEAKGDDVEDKDDKSAIKDQNQSADPETSIEVSPGMIEDEAPKGETDMFHWKQLDDEIELTFKKDGLKKGQKKVVKVQFQKNHLRVEALGDVLIDADLFAPIYPDESTWTLSDGILQVTLAKATDDEWEKATKD